MNQGIWKVYKSKVLKSFTVDEEEEEIKEQNNDTVMDVTAEEGPSSVSQLAKKVQGASAKGWKCMSSLFNKDDEHKLLPAENTAPVEHVLSEPAPQEPGPEKKLTGFWDTFATKWNQTSEANRSSEGAGAGAGAGEGEAPSATHSEGGGAENMPSSGEYTNLEEPSDPGFKWNFVTSKLAELKNKKVSGRGWRQNPLIVGKPHDDLVSFTQTVHGFGTTLPTRDWSRSPGGSLSQALSHLEKFSASPVPAPCTSQELAGFL